jgi:DNA-binding GntR family transcriptional regulator
MVVPILVTSGRSIPVAVESNPHDPRAYIRLAVQVREQIAEGELQPGYPTPSISMLVQDHGCARQTAGKALRLLVDEGLLYRVPGLGYHVADDARERLNSS